MYIFDGHQINADLPNWTVLILQLDKGKLFGKFQGEALVYQDVEY